MVGSCAESGCADFIVASACQCDKLCRHYKNCCSDYEEECLGPDAKGFRLESGWSSQKAGSCAVYGCVQHVPEQLCQCHADCVPNGACCHDFPRYCPSVALAAAAAATPTRRNVSGDVPREPPDPWHPISHLIVAHSKSG